MNEPRQVLWRNCRGFSPFPQNQSDSTMDEPKPRLQLLAVHPMVFECSTCGEKFEGNPAAGSVWADFENHVKEKHSGLAAAAAT